MPRVHINDKKIKSLKTTKLYDDFWDTGFRVRNVSYGIRVFSNGKKKHTARYRRQDGKQCRMMLGDYPKMCLATAHEKARALATTLDSGIDPARERDHYKVAESFSELADLYLKLHAAKKKKPRGYKEDQRVINVFLNPAWGHLKACDVKRKDVVALLDYIHVERNTPIQANRVHALIHKIFNFAIPREIIEANPCAGIPKVAKENRRERVLKEDEIKKLWQILKHLKEPTANLFKLILLTAQRPGEVKSMRWSDIADKMVWQIPSEITKNSRTHRVPLSSHARRILEELRASASLRKSRSRKDDTSGFDEYVFHNQRGPHIKWLQRATLTVNKLFANEDATLHASKRAATTLMEHENFTPHDLRRTAATYMRALGASRDTIAKILNHKSAEHSVTGIYDRYDEWPEMEKALEAWGEKVDLIVSKNKVAKTADNKEKNAGVQSKPSRTVIREQADR